MIKLINDSVVETAKILAENMQKFFDTNNKLNNTDRPWLDLLNWHLANKKPNGSYPKYSISKFRFLIGFLGPKYLLE